MGFEKALEPTDKPSYRDTKSHLKTVRLRIWNATTLYTEISDTCFEKAYELTNERELETIELRHLILKDGVKNQHKAGVENRNKKYIKIINWWNKHWKE